MSCVNYFGMTMQFQANSVHFMPLYKVCDDALKKTGRDKVGIQNPMFMHAIMHIIE